MPAKSNAQRRFFGAELGRRKVGIKTRTGLSTKILREFAEKIPGNSDRNFSESRQVQNRRAPMMNNPTANI